MMPDTHTTREFELADGEYAVAVSKLLTPNGERLLVESDGDSARLDALALETLTWQDDAFFQELTGQPHDEGDETEAGEPLQVSNEYTTIVLRPLETAAGPRLAVRSQKMDYECRVSPAELAALARERVDFFSELLATPLGPESDHQHIV
jgi:hypothetical protein